MRNKPEKDSTVKTAIVSARTMSPSIPPMPASPVAQPRRRNKITPMTFSETGMYAEGGLGRRLIRERLCVGGWPMAEPESPTTHRR